MYIKENNDKKNNKRLVRPFSALNIRSFHSNNSNNHNNSTFEKLIKKEDNETNLINKNEIDLDLLFEKQLQKLREINKQDDINDKNEENHKIYINNNINSINNNIDQNIQNDSNNEKFGINNTIINIKGLILGHLLIYQKSLNHYLEFLVQNIIKKFIRKKTKIHQIMIIYN